MSIVSNLKALNSKERYYLFTAAIGTDGMQLSPDYINAIEEIFDIRIPPDYFAGVDYHLDWIYAALHIDDIHDYKKIYPNAGNVIEGKQEDIDLIIAYEEKGITHIVLIEAKCAGKWNSKQLISKSNRFEKIFKSIDESKIKIHFLLTSPREPRKIQTENLSKYMKTGKSIKWIKMNNVPDLIMVTRIDKKRNHYQNWRLKRRS